MIISINAGKEFDKIQHTFMIKKKTPKKLGLGRDYLNIIKAICEKPAANIILTVKKMKAFPLRTGSRQRFPLRIAEDAKKHKKTKF